MKIKKIYLGSDHAGYELKNKVKRFLLKKKIPYEDLGTDSEKSTDYPQYAKAVSQKVSKDRNSRGILICGTGTGMVIAANRKKGIRAVAAYDTYSAKMSRFDNNTNVLCLRARKFPFFSIKNIMNVWLETPFSKESRHKRRIEKLDK